MSDQEYIANLEKLLEDAQSDLWVDLDIALHTASNGYWSIGAQGKINQLARIILIMGPTPPGRVQIPLLSSGVYYAVLDKLGIKYEKLDLTGHEQHFHTEERWAEETVECIKSMELELD